MFFFQSSSDFGGSWAFERSKTQLQEIQNEEKKIKQMEF